MVTEIRVLCLVLFVSMSSAAQSVSTVDLVKFGTRRFTQGDTRTSFDSFFGSCNGKSGKSASRQLKTKLSSRTRSTAIRTALEVEKGVIKKYKVTYLFLYSRTAETIDDNREKESYAYLYEDPSYNSFLVSVENGATKITDKSGKPLKKKLEERVKALELTDGRPNEWNSNLSKAVAGESMRIGQSVKFSADSDYFFCPIPFDEATSDLMKVRATLKEIREVNGVRCGIFTLDFDLRKMKILGPSNTVMTLKDLSAKGEAAVCLKTSRRLKFHFIAKNVATLSAPSVPSAGIGNFIMNSNIRDSVSFSRVRVAK